MSSTASEPAAPEFIEDERVATPTVLQLERVECGAAALGMVLALHDRWVPLEELRLRCGVSRDGVNAKNILKAARSYELEGSGRKLGADRVFERPMPQIVWWNINHFLVLEGRKGDTVYLNDPASGQRTCTMEEFRSSYSGIALEFTEGAQFQPGGSPPSLLGGLAARTQNFRPSVIYFTITALLLIIPALAQPAFLRIFIDEILIAQRESWVRPLLTTMAGTVVVLGTLIFCQQFYLLRYQSCLALAASARFFTHVLRLPAAFFSQRAGGEVGSRVAICDNIARMVAEKLSQFIVDCFRTLFFGVVMFFYDAPLAIATLLLSSVNYVTIHLLARVRVDNNRRLLQDEGKLLATSQGGLQMIETIKGTGGEEEFFSRWTGYQAKTLLTKQKLGFLAHCTAALPPTIEGLTTAVLLGYGGIRIMERGDGFSIGMLVAFMAVVQNFSQPFGEMVSFGGRLQELQGDMSRIDDVLNHHQDASYSYPQSARPDCLRLSGLVELDKVSFGYNPLGKPLVEEFSMVIRPGQRIALVGGSGSGKSTIAKLVSGLYQPLAGEIRFDGIPRQDVPADLINNSMAVIDQDIFLFEGTVRENVTMWDATVPDDKVLRALRDAAMLDRISARPGGLSSMVEEGGLNFSGGERQRLEIARALLNDPTFLVLDEATSALDPPTEKIIERNLMRRGCSCLIVAHRLSTIRDADEIIVLRQGQVVDRGKHDELMARKGAYYELIKA